MDAGSLRNSNWSLATLVVAACLGIGAFSLPEALLPAWLPLLAMGVFFIAYLLTFGFYVEAKGYSWIIAVGLMLLSVFGVLIAAFLPDRNTTSDPAVPSIGPGPSALNVARIIVLLLVSSTALAVKTVMRDLQAAEPGERREEVVADPASISLKSSQGTFHGGFRDHDGEINQFFQARGTAIHSCDAWVVTVEGTLSEAGEEEGSVYVSAMTIELDDGSLYIEAFETAFLGQEPEFERTVVRRDGDGTLAAVSLAQHSYQRRLPRETLLPMQVQKMLLSAANQGETKRTYITLNPSDSTAAVRATSEISRYTGELLTDEWPQAWLIATKYWPHEDVAHAPIETDVLVLTPDGLELFYGSEDTEMSSAIQLVENEFIDTSCDTD